MKKGVYGVLLMLTVLFTTGGVLTLIPAAGATYPNVLGYRSLCTFAPAASFFCFFAAGLTCFVRSTFVKDDEGGSKQEKFKRHSHSLVPVIFVLLLAIAGSVWFGVVKSGYSGGGGTEAVSGATAG